MASTKLPGKFVYNVGKNTIEPASNGIVKDPLNSNTQKVFDVMFSNVSSGASLLAHFSLGAKDFSKGRDLFENIARKMGSSFEYPLVLDTDDGKTLFLLWVVGYKDTSLFYIIQSLDFLKEVDKVKKSLRNK